ncbi:MAG TPA: gluconate 2-dehydrogenase subunit 3 family protein [Steroidobacteraceae bacterium]|nr:gluconate 2-dehydrogenase subunit 3 family protein [Steroidobacteraceae bacterium]
MSGIRRRDVLKGTALALVGSGVARGNVISREIPWHPDAGEPPEPVKPGPWKFFTAEEAAAVEALVDRIIPPDAGMSGGTDAGTPGGTDAGTPGGKGAGCAVYLDRQLAGPYGRFAGLYTRPPFNKGIKQQGPQSSQTPAELYRKALAALDHYCRAGRDGKPFAELSSDRQDEILHGLESETVKLEGLEGTTFFEALVKDTQQGFFADPIYGGNRDLCAWKMIGFPGTRYDYRDWVGRHNERYPLPPVGIGGRADWNPGKG